MSELRTLLTGVVLGESPRWHDDRLWFSDWGAQEVLTVDLAGKSETVLRVPAFPFSFDWLPDGQLVVVLGDGLLQSQAADGSLETQVDLTGLSVQPWNEIVVDGRGNIYLNNIGFAFGSEEPAPGFVAVVTPAGEVRQVAADLMFPNGMAVTPDDSTLIVAESYANQLTAFDIEADGSLSNRRVWADLGDGYPDGITLDAEGAVWYADVPNKRCVRVREGGEVLQTVEVDRGCFACMLGGPDGSTLFILAAEWRGPDSIGDPTGQVLTIPAPAAHAGRP